MSMFKWDVVDPGPGEAVAPHQRLAWGKTVGLGAQHVIAMFGATFVFPIIMGLDANLAIMMSGIATICFLLIVRGKVPSYLGTSVPPSSVARPRSTPRAAARPTSPARSWLAGMLLALVGVVIHFLGPGAVNAVLPPVVTGAVVMLIGFNLAPVATLTYMPADPWVAHAHDDRGHPDGGRVPWLPRPDRDLPRADLRLRHLLARRHRLRPDLQPDAGVRRPGSSRPRRLDHRQRRRLVRLPVAHRRGPRRQPDRRPATSPPSAGTCRASR